MKSKFSQYFVSAGTVDVNRKNLKILGSVCSIFQQNFDKVYFWYH